MDRKRQHIINFIVTLIIIAVCVIIIVISFNIKAKVEQDFANSTNQPNAGTSTVTPDPEKPTLPSINEITEAKFINLQPALDKWLTTLTSSEKAGVMIYDLNNSRTAASYQENEIFNVASIYKLLFAYDGYRQISLGLERSDEIIIRGTEKGDLTLLTCLDLIVRESYNGCADVMNKDQTRIARISGLIKTLEMTNTGNIGLESTAADLTKLLRTFWRHTELSNNLWLALSDSLLNQPPSATTDHPIYDWRQGLPAGFSDNVNVYNKVGWEWNGESWNTYADAAIIDFTNYQHYYTVVVLTKNLSDHRKITQLGQMIEETVTMQNNGVIK